MDPTDISIYDFLPVGLLGKGKLGEVYLVKDIKNGAKFAMKKLDKDKIIK
jgi:serine/threonine protein kinase